MAVGKWLRCRQLVGGTELNAPSVRATRRMIAPEASRRCQCGHRRHRAMRARVGVDG